VLDRELRRGRDLHLRDVTEGALGERGEPAQRLDLDVEHVHPHRPILGGREYVEEAAAQRELPALCNLIDALVPRRDELSRALLEIEQLAHAQRERARPQRRIGNLLRQRDGADDHHRWLLVRCGGAQQRVQRGDAQTHEVRRRRQVGLVGDAARRVVAHPPGLQPCA